MATKTDIKALLKRGGLTGAEVGRLVLQDSVEVDQDRPGFLTSADIRIMVDSLPPSEGRVYNQYMEAFRAVTLTIAQASSIVLEALLSLERCHTIQQAFITEWLAAGLGESVPHCVTQEQYERIKAEWTERKLQEPLWLMTGVCYMAEGSRLTEGYEEDLDLGEVEYKTGSYEWVRETVSWVREEYPEVLQELIELVKAGRLKPVPMSPKYQTELRALLVTIAELRAGYWPEGRGPEDLQEDGRLPGETEEELEASVSKDREVTYPKICRLVDQTEALYVKAYKAGLKKWTDKTREAVVRDLERLQAGTLSEEEEDRLMTRTLLSGRELYEAGVSSWVKRIDEGPRPWEVYKDADYVAQEFAIVINPDTGNVDKEGNYTKTYDLLATEVNLIDRIGGRIGREELVRALKSWRSVSIDQVKLYMALKSVVQTLSEVMGVDFTEDFKRYDSRLEPSIELFNSRCKIPGTRSMPRITPINLERLKPSASSLRYYKERFAMSLGNEWETAGTWFKDARETLIDSQEEEAHG